MKSCDVLIIGAGPAGLMAALSAAEAGASVVVLERAVRAGGQLVKQTHMFFGSREQYASVRGVDIPAILLNKLAKYGDKVEIICSCTALGAYEDGVITALWEREKYLKFKPESLVIATGAYEKSLTFPGNDLPGVYGAGAVQTLTNVHGVRPGNRVIMVGAGNIGLIVSYQLLQAGVEVVAVLDAAPKIGGYLVHAAKLARMGVPILVSHSVTAAYGKDCLERVAVSKLDEGFKPIEGSTVYYDVDACCVSVGLSPLSELPAMAGCGMCYIPQLGGMVPVRDEEYETTVKGIFVAGDVSGIEEASAAMVEGRLAGLYAAKRAGFAHEGLDTLAEECRAQLASLRGGESGGHIRAGLKLLSERGERNA